MPAPPAPAAAAAARSSELKLLLISFLCAAVFLGACGKVEEDSNVGAKTVIQYDAIPNYADWTR